MTGTDIVPWEQSPKDWDFDADVRAAHAAGCPKCDGSNLMLATETPREYIICIDETTPKAEYYDNESYGGEYMDLIYCGNCGLTLWRSGTGWNEVLWEKMELERG